MGSDALVDLGHQSGGHWQMLAEHMGEEEESPLRIVAGGKGEQTFRCHLRPLDAYLNAPLRQIAHQGSRVENDRMHQASSTAWVTSPTRRPGTATGICRVA